MNVPVLLIRIEKMKRRLQCVVNPDKRLKLSQELDKLLNEYYRIRMTGSALL
ncbi:MAG: aspartyl-phosphate phosphatase Spo0E family protein [Actinobacteria bacterium]|nr:aspartyl-phosphate phosphatase Spo0E family protein [Actinomycetota bacterium]